MQGWRKRLTIGALLLAAFASYVDLPRLNVVTHLGDTLNAIRVMDPVQHTRMQQVLDQLLLKGEGIQLSSDLQDGNESLDLLSDSILLNAFVPPMFQLNAPVLLDDEGFKVGEHNDLLPLTGMPSALFQLDLPPPRSQTMWQPPRTQCPTSLHFSHTARGPPIALR